jgi:hypothetical protein
MVRTGESRHTQKETFHVSLGPPQIPSSRAEGSNPRRLLKCSMKQILISQCYVLLCVVISKIYCNHLNPSGFFTYRQI